MNNTFNELGITAPILKALGQMGFEEPTEVQTLAIPHILNREDLIVMSKTGSGKTAVFGVPMLQLTDPQAPGPQGLILTPTRELAVQVDSDIRRMGKHMPHRMTAVYGQHNMNTEIEALAKGVTIVTGTPGRVFDHISHGQLNTKNIKFLVLDEADRMLDMGFLDQVERIVKTVPKDRITMLFSATIPAEVRKLCQRYMKNPVTIEIESETMTVDTIQQAYYRIDPNEKRTQLNRLLLFERPESCLIFCNTRYTVDRVQSFLAHKGYSCQALHGDITQAKRLKTLQRFQQGDFHILVATDVAARGIHIDDLSLVVNYDVPIERDSYVHRIGRTGRAGNGGKAISLVTSDDIMTLYEIEEHIGTLINEAEVPTDALIYQDRTAVNKWIEANAPKAGSIPVGSKSSQQDAKNKQFQSKPAQRNSRNKKRPDVATVKPDKSAQVAPEARTEARKAITPETRAAKPIPAPTPTVQVNANQEVVLAKGSPTKRSLLKRIVTRVFGER